MGRVTPTPNNHHSRQLTSHIVHMYHKSVATAGIRMKSKQKSFEIMGIK
jgi:hypothetical protein